MYESHEPMCKNIRVRIESSGTWHHCRMMETSLNNTKPCQSCNRVNLMEVLLDINSISSQCLTNITHSTNGVCLTYVSIGTQQWSCRFILPIISISLLCNVRWMNALITNKNINKMSKQRCGRVFYKRQLQIGSVSHKHSTFTLNKMQ